MTDNVHRHQLAGGRQGLAVPAYLNDDHYDVTFIPINEDIEQGESTVLPRQVAEEMVRRAAHRVILPICLCRVGCRCRITPWNWAASSWARAPNRSTPAWAGPSRWKKPSSTSTRPSEPG